MHYLRKGQDPLINPWQRLKATSMRHRRGSLKLIMKIWQNLILAPIQTLTVETLHWRSPIFPLTQLDEEVTSWPIVTNPKDYPEVLCVATMDRDDVSWDEMANTLTNLSYEFGD